jgi:dTDP-4-amino-4,6-dideoxygalactose transaminase
VSEQLAIDGGTPVRTAEWPSWPIWGEQEQEQLLEVLHAGEWNIHEGGKVTQFEDAFAAYQGAEHGIAVTSGTAALELALRALGIGPGDEVITSSYTFSATVAAIFKVGAQPVLADIDAGTLNLDPEDVEKRITDQTEALMPVHIGGCPADMDGILDIAERYDLAVIEDACQAWGAEWKDHRVGALGDIGAFSFQASKNINAGEGGMAVTNDTALADRIWALHNAGRMPGRSRHEMTFLGYNYRMTEFQAGILLAQLERLPAHTMLREENAAHLDQLLDGIAGITPRVRDPRVTQHAMHLYMFHYTAAAFGGLSRADFLEAMRAEGIPCSPGYQPMNHALNYRRALAEQMGWLEPWQEEDVELPEVEPLPVVEKACQETVWLYQWQMLADGEAMKDVAAAIHKIQQARS